MKTRRRLTKDQHEAIWALTFGMGFSQRKVARMLDISRHTVRYWLAKEWLEPE